MSQHLFLNDVSFLPICFARELLTMYTIYKAIEPSTV